MGDGLEHTLTTFGDRPEHERAGAAPCLFLALEYDRPTTPGARLVLSGVDEVALGRGERRSFAIGDRTLAVALPDPRMSSRHARIERAMGQWFVVDLDSKNGVVVNGERTSRAALADGDRIELGHTLFLFRDAVEAAGAVSEIAQVDPAAEVPGLATLVPSLERELGRLRDVAATDVPILVLGETGTGKELAARAVHALSGRAGALVAANCGALPEGVFESQMFGHRKGAFSGAVEDRPGFIRSADGGTLFLDEVGDLLARPQAALLRALQEREVIPVGETSPIRVDVRVVSATNRSLEERVAAGEFRADLRARLEGFVVALPPLRERREDLGMIVGTLLGQITTREIRFHRDAVAALYAHDWPMNIRELHGALASAIALAKDGTIGPEHLPESVRAPHEHAAPAPAPTASPVDPERARIEEALRQCGGNQTRAAKRLGISRRTLSRWLDAHEVPRPKKEH